MKIAQDIKKVIKQNFKLHIGFIFSVFIINAKAFDRIPLSIINNLPYVKITVDHLEGLALVDTGCVSCNIVLYSTITKKLINETQLTGRKLMTNLASVDSENEFIQVKKFQFGDLIKNNVRIQISDQSALAFSTGDDSEIKANIIGLLGLEFLKNHIFIIDDKEKVLIRIEENELMPLYFSNWSDLDYDSDGIVLPVKIDGRVKRLILDSGSDFSLLNKNRFNKSINVSQIEKNQDITRRYPNFVPHDVNIASCLINIHSFVIYPMNRILADGLIGYEVFKNHVVLLDIPHKRLAFEC